MYHSEARLTCFMFGRKWGAMDEQIYVLEGESGDRVQTSCNLGVRRAEAQRVWWF